MDFEIFRARTDVEPSSLIENDAADLAAFADPIGDNRNERNFFLRRNSLEDGRIPNRDIGKIVIAGDAVAVRDVHDAAVAEGNRFSQAGFTQGQSDIVAALKVFVY